MSRPQLFHCVSTSEPVLLKDMSTSLFMIDDVLCARFKFEDGRTGHLIGLAVTDMPDAADKAQALYLQHPDKDFLVQPVVLHPEYAPDEACEARVFWVPTK